MIRIQAIFWTLWLVLVRLGPPSWSNKANLFGDPFEALSTAVLMLSPSIYIYIVQQMKSFSLVESNIYWFYMYEEGNDFPPCNQPTNQPPFS